MTLSKSPLREPTGKCVQKLSLVCINGNLISRTSTAWAWSNAMQSLIQWYGTFRRRDLLSVVLSLKWPAAGHWASARTAQQNGKMAATETSKSHSSLPTRPDFFLLLDDDDERGSQLPVSCQKTLIMEIVSLT